MAEEHRENEELDWIKQKIRIKTSNRNWKKLKTSELNRGFKNKRKYFMFYFQTKKQNKKELLLKKLKN